MNIKHKKLILVTYAYLENTKHKIKIKISTVFYSESNN